MAARHGCSPRPLAVAARRGCSLWPLAAAACCGCSPRLLAAAAHRGCSPWLLAVAARRGCSPRLLAAAARRGRLPWPLAAAARCALETCLENKNPCGFNNPQTTLVNCSSQNFSAIAEAHYTCYIDLIEVNNEFAYHHKEEGLFYQHTAWEKEQEQISKFKVEKWNLYYKKDPKKLWNMLDWKGKIKQVIAGPPNIIHFYFDKIFNAVKIQKNPLIKESKREVHSYEKFNDATDKQFDHADLNYDIAKIGCCNSYLCVYYILFFCYISAFLTIYTHLNGENNYYFL